MIKGSHRILVSSLWLSSLALSLPIAQAQAQGNGPVRDNEVQDENDPIPEPERPSTIPETAARRKPSTIMGFGYLKNTDIGEYNHYEKLYGKTEKTINLQMGRYLYTYGIDIGLSAKFGYFNAGGHPLKSLSNCGSDADPIALEVPLKRNIPDGCTTDENQKIELTLIPVQTLLELAYSPFPVSRRLVIRGYIGPEFLYVQEVLKPNVPSNQELPEGTQLVSSGWNQGLVTGIMLSISVSGYEARSDYALKSIGVDRTYISPFYEVVTTTNDKMGNYDRKSYGISLQFEGLR
ncbi:MAG: hypothetical protein EOP10_09105 [Proteobacteria bacterium]|nr:MAG: hypothetical protein EOP10_09105 [Pseudomonadota bacterium]